MTEANPDTEKTNQPGVNSYDVYELAKHLANLANKNSPSINGRKPEDYIQEATAQLIKNNNKQKK